MRKHQYPVPSIITNFRKLSSVCQWMPNALKKNAYFYLLKHCYTKMEGKSYHKMRSDKMEGRIKTFMHRSYVKLSEETSLLKCRKVTYIKIIRPEST